MFRNTLADDNDSDDDKDSNGDKDDGSKAASTYARQRDAIVEAIQVNY